MALWCTLIMGKILLCSWKWSTVEVESAYCTVCFTFAVCEWLVYVLTTIGSSQETLCLDEGLSVAAQPPWRWCWFKNSSMQTQQSGYQRPQIGMTTALLSLQWWISTSPRRNSFPLCSWYSNARSTFQKDNRKFNILFVFPKVLLSRPTTLSYF